MIVTSRKERTKRVVVLLADTPQKRDCRPSPEQVNSRTAAFQRPTLSVLVRASTGTETTWRQQKLWVWLCISFKKRCPGEVVIVSLSGVTTWERQETEDQETEENALNSHHYHANETSFTMQPCLQETPVTFLINLPHSPAAKPIPLMLSCMCMHHVYC